MPITLSTLFTTPQDLWDRLSVEGVDLRLDDHNLSSGQMITVSADAAAGATSLTISSLSVPLLRGTVLTFDGGGMTVPIQATLSAVAQVGATSLAVSALGNPISSGAQARDSGVNVACAARMVVAARQGTSKVKLYCNGRYDDSQLALSGSVLDWATTYGCLMLCARRAQATPKSIIKAWDLAWEELKMVQVGQLAIEDCATRGTDWPAMSNICVNPALDVMRVRVQPEISEQTPTAYPQYIDWNSAFALGY